MMNFTETMNEQFKQMAEMQTKGFEPMKTFATVATEAAEQFARQNYAVAGDFIDFAVKQANAPLNSENINDVTKTQMADATSFSELMNNRAAEYADIAQQFGGKAKEAVETASASFK